MLSEPSKQKLLALPLITLLLSGCLTKQEQSNFADTAQNNAPSISGSPPTSVEIGQDYQFTPTASDPDGDAVSFNISNLPVWASFDSTTGQLSGIPSNAGSFSNIIISASDGQASTSLDPFAIEVTNSNITPVNTAPTISGNPTRSVGVGQAYSFTPTAADADGDALTFAITNQPAWASFDTTNGRLSGTPNNAGNFADIRISVSDGQATTDLPPFSITVTATNNVPAISGVPQGSVEVGDAYSFTPTASDADGDTLSFSIANQPAWAAFDTATGELSGTPPSGSAGTYANIGISVSDGQDSASLSAFSIEVTDSSGTPTNNSPTISGNPTTNIRAGEFYDFTPNAADADGDTLTFSITNAPGWAAFDTATGRLSGQPTNAGDFTNIRISVSDGQDSANLAPFSISVTADNSAPTISGSPATSVDAGQTYTFTPTANDVDGDTLTFSIANQPAWASFDTATGRLSGTPTSSDVGSFTGIVISVSDGQESASLASFRIDVNQVTLQSTTLDWTAPTRNEDGSTLTDLASFKIYYGTSSRNYTTEIEINNPSVTSYVVDNLVPDTYYFAVTAIDANGDESRFSGELVTDLN